MCGGITHPLLSVSDETVFKMSPELNNVQSD